MATRNSKVIICNNINLDKNYKNVLDYTTEQMVALCNSHKVASDDEYSFVVGNRNEIVVNFSYSTCLSANYMAFQNPDYSNKWFFAFIDDVEYTSDSATTIRYTIDSWSTWFDYWTANMCFVEREHTNDDSIGANLQPEQLEHGEYVMADNYTKTNITSYPCICIEATKNIEFGTASGGGLANNIFTGTIKYLFKTDSHASAAGHANAFLDKFDSLGYGESIVGVYMIPWDFVANATWYDTNPGVNNAKYGLLGEEDEVQPFDFGDYTALAPSTLAGGYTPKNNKLYTFPYRYCLVSNNAGIEIPMHYENFANNQPVFHIEGSITPGCSIKLTPMNYKGILNNYDESIIGGKLPICSWSTDMYTNWLTQTSLNRNINLAVSGLQTVVGAGRIAAGDVTGVGDVASGLGGIKNEIVEKYEHSFMPPQANGNLNSGDINFTLGICDFIFYHYSIKPEFARVIDDFWTRFGYQTNRLKVPNITGRRYWNYIKIGYQEELGKGTVPANDMEIINDIAHKGTTIWHDHENVNNFSLNNYIL